MLDFPLVVKRSMRGMDRTFLELVNFGQVGLGFLLRSHGGGGGDHEVDVLHRHSGGLLDELNIRTANASHCSIKGDCKHDI